MTVTADSGYVDIDRTGSRVRFIKPYFRNRTGSYAAANLVLQMANGGKVDREHPEKAVRLRSAVLVIKDQ
jgi:hypothetical protein